MRASLVALAASLLCLIPAADAGAATVGNSPAANAGVTAGVPPLAVLPPAPYSPPIVLGAGIPMESSPFPNAAGPAASVLYVSAAPQAARREDAAAKNPEAENLPPGLQPLYAYAEQSRDALGGPAGSAQLYVMAGAPFDGTARTAAGSEPPRIAWVTHKNGLRVPVLDITEPSMAPAHPPDSRFLGFKSLVFLKILQILPDWMRAGLARKSVILADFLARREFVSGFPTYLAKLGKRHVPGSLFDRLAADSKQSVAIRYRLGHMAALESNALDSALRRHPEARTVRFVNIAGGPAFDSINAVLSMLADPVRAGLLRGKSVRIAVFDFNEEGADFGRRSVAALKAPGMKFEGLDIQLEHIHYDWSDPASLKSAIERWARDGDVLLGSSEGGLLEYGSDRDIAGNLRALHEAAPDDFSFTFSNSKNRVEIHPVVLEILKIAPMKFQLRGLEGGTEADGRPLKGIRALLEENGWTIQETASDDATYDAVTVRKAPR